jgi:hypothetical protein
VARACHALSIDDARQSFDPVTWDERLEDDPERITQMWFAGVHANVGGGYPKRQMALVSLKWMLEQVAAFDASLGPDGPPRLRLIPQAFETISAAADVQGRLYDSRAGVGVIYRYAPRDLAAIAAEYTEHTPLIHESTLARIDQATDRYAPFNFCEPPLPRGRKDDGRGLGAWRDAMLECWGIAFLRRRLYGLGVLLGLGLSLKLVHWLASLVSLRPPGWIDAALGSHWALWIPLLGMLLLLLVRQRLVLDQSRRANSGWAHVAPRHRPRPDPDDAGSSWLREIGRLRSAPGLRLVAGLWESLLVRALALGLFPFLRGGAIIHSAWRLRDLPRRELEQPTPLDPGESRVRVLETNDFVHQTDLQLEEGACYRIAVERWSGWFDADWPATPNGLRVQRGFMKLARALLRDPRQPMFGLLARVGHDHPVWVGTGAVIRPETTGMLQFFVNDVDLRLPLFRDLFYDNNRGVARIRIERLPDEAGVEPEPSGAMRISRGV